MAYIDRDIIERLIMKDGLYCDTDADKLYSVKRIRSLPTADVVEVVRCKDCIHGIPTRIDTVTGEFSDVRYCNRHRMCHFEDYYCADGKRKETEDGQE